MTDLISFSGKEISDDRHFWGERDRAGRGVKDTALARTMFVNLPVQDLDRAVTFFTALGFRFSSQFTDERAAAMVVNEEAFVMLLVQEFFTTFTGQPVPATSEVVVALSASSPDEVDELVARALAAGGGTAQDKISDGPMYGWSFLDPDGHHWELIHMALPEAAPADR